MVELGKKLGFIFVIDLVFVIDLDSTEASMVKNKRKLQTKYPHWKTIGVSHQLIPLEYPTKSMVEFIFHKSEHLRLMFNERCMNMNSSCITLKRIKKKRKKKKKKKSENAACEMQTQWLCNAVTVHATFIEQYPQMLTFLQWTVHSCTVYRPINSTFQQLFH